MILVGKPEHNLSWKAGKEEITWETYDVDNIKMDFKYGI
jgi:hypothetical protein